MKTPRFLRLSLFIILHSAVVIPSHAGPRTSASYAITADTIDGGGAHTTSASYTNEGSLSFVTGISSVAAPAETVKNGYLGQLYEVVGLQLSASPTTTLNEGATRQLNAGQLLDDLTTIPVANPVVAWGVVSGPITHIANTGIAFADIVYQNTPATVQGTFGGFTGMLGLTVLDSIPDNWGAYAGDGVGDDWQVQYFGQPPNASAGPTVDFDGDGQNNLFEYTAGLNPLDPSSRFTFRIAPVPGQPGQKNLTFSPLVLTGGRSYTVKAKTSLLTLGGWGAISASAPSDNGTERTITDLSATGPVKFYEVEITKP